MRAAAIGYYYHVFDGCSQLTEQKVGAANGGKTRRKKSVSSLLPEVSD